MLFPNGKQTLFQKKWLPNKSFGQAKGSLHKSPSIHPYSTQKPSEKWMIIQRNTDFGRGWWKLLGTLDGSEIPKQPPVGWCSNPDHKWWYFNYRSLNWCLPRRISEPSTIYSSELGIFYWPINVRPCQKEESVPLTFRWIFCSGFGTKGSDGES